MISAVVLVVVWLLPGGKAEHGSAVMPSPELCERAGEAFAAGQPPALEFGDTWAAPRGAGSRFWSCVHVETPGRDA
jgi:hypothetical protein